MPSIGGRLSSAPDVEGFVAKDPESTYCSGIHDVDAFDGVLVGERVGEDLHFRGIVEWGFRAADVLELLREAKYAPQRLSPFVDLPRMSSAVWLAPRFQAEVSTPRSQAAASGRRRGEASCDGDGA